MTDRTVTQAYLLGISEGRAAFRALGPGDDLSADARTTLDILQTLLRQGFAGDMRDCLRGERDFWRNQVKQLSKGE